MKKLIVSFTVIMMSFSAFAADKISASKDEAMQMLDLVVGVHQTYSEASQLQAKVIEILGGDGMNPTRMILSLSTGYTDSPRLFDLGKMMFGVTRITFLGKDVIVINYTQDSFEDADAMVPVQIQKSLKITALRNVKGELTEEILTEDISK